MRTEEKGVQLARATATAEELKYLGNLYNNACSAIDEISRSAKVALPSIKIDVLWFKRLPICLNVVELLLNSEVLIPCSTLL